VQLVTLNLVREQLVLQEVTCCRLHNYDCDFFWGFPTAGLRKSACGHTSFGKLTNYWMQMWSCEACPMEQTLRGLLFTMPSTFREFADIKVQCLKVRRLSTSYFWDPVSNSIAVSSKWHVQAVIPTKTGEAAIKKLKIKPSSLKSICHL
jgi:hypothetical protein